jgi:hypothetical protein
MNFIEKIFVFHLLMSTFLCDFVSCWSVRIPGRRAFRQVEKQTIETHQDIKLFYTNGNEDHDLQYIFPSSVAKTLHLPKASLQAPNQMNLPIHSPPREVVENMLFLWDFEMIFGRVAMIASLLFCGGEFATGLSVADQMNEVFFIN